MKQKVHVHSLDASLKPKMYAVHKCKWIRHLEYAYFSFFLTHLEIEMMQKM